MRESNSKGSQDNSLTVMPDMPQEEEEPLH